MLFNSAEFLIGFLPIVLLGFFLLAGAGRQRAAAGWLTLASLVFYGWWNPQYLPLLIGSMVFNFLLGGYLIRRRSRMALLWGIAANLLLLGYYKYSGFMVSNIDQAFGTHWTMAEIVLPLAISFFTFQQLAYLSDAYDGMVVEHDFLNYCLFITFFPHLIAGPITHHREMLEQFRDPERFRPKLLNLSLGATLFLLGLFKKVVFADFLGGKASPMFAAVADGFEPSMLDAWTGALSYTLQIYFDFSGYSDMAIGLGLMFGISLPVNFNSPFKARNVIDFWSRWHMTLTRFLTAYVYNPIVLKVTRARTAAGKPLPRRGKMTASTFFALVAYPTALTMLVSGVWHGAGWQYIAFGLLHGFYLVVAHGWRALKASQGWKLDSDRWWHQAASVLLTFLCVVVAMVFFRSADLRSALALLAGMAGTNGIVVDSDMASIAFVSSMTQHFGLPVAPLDFFTPRLALQIALLLVFVWSLPNTQEWMHNYRTALNWRPQGGWMGRYFPSLAWRPSPALGAVMGIGGFFALALATSAAPTEFLYFQF